MPAASLGKESELPPLVSDRELHEAAHADGVPDEIVRNLGWGHVPNVLPYSMQDGYERRLAQREFVVAVLENDRLCATFLLGHGGRLWSLLDKASGRELLYRNQGVQYGNLALRNAWFAGGVEWNCGVIGHSPQTCAPVWAARVEGPDGDPVLRLYEYERIRGVLYQLDFRLPGASPFLFVSLTIRNPNDETIPMYWWSNIAVRQAADVRVLVPARRAFSFGYRASLDIVPFPVPQGFDASFPSRATMPRDYFFDVPPSRRKWIAAVDESGHGIVQASTARLKGRKLFVWGTGPAGANWQRLLSPLGGEYFEIQAGLAHTQLEYLPMAPGAEWTWTEAYGPASDVPRGNFEDDVAAMERSLEADLPTPSLERVASEAAGFRHRAPSELLHEGSGWAAVEQVRRRLDAEASLPTAGLPFRARPGSDEERWIACLERGEEPPSTSFQVGESWARRLGEHPLHAGIVAYYAGASAEAVRGWYRARSGRCEAVALRNVAVACEFTGETQGAVTAYQAALRAGEPSLPLAREALRCFAEHAPEAVAESLLSFTRAMLDDGRVRLYGARAALALGDPEPARRFFADGVVVADLREGDRALESLWAAYRETTGEPEDMPVSMRLAMTD